MYNRYIPQGDGTYRRNRIPDPRPEPQRPAPSRDREKQAEYSPAPEPPNCQNCIHNSPPRFPAPPPRPRKPVSPTGLGSFFKQLLPRDFDTEDLIVVLLLLLMAGDCQNDQNSPLITLVLYLFM